MEKLNKNCIENFYDNGQILSRVSFLEKSDCLETHCDSLKKSFPLKKSETKIKDGFSIFWFPNGSLKSQVCFSNGVKEGLEEIWFVDGGPWYFGDRLSFRLNKYIGGRKENDQKQDQFLHCKN